MNSKMIAPALLALLAAACSPSNSDQQTKPDTKSTTGLATHPSPTDFTNLQSLDGFWADQKSGDLIFFHSDYDSNKQVFETKVAALDFRNEINYTFLGTSEKDQLLLETNPETQRVESLVKRTVNGAQTVIRIEFAREAGDLLRVDVSAAGKSGQHRYVRAADQAAAERKFSRVQTDLARRAHSEIDSARDTSWCSDFVDISDTACTLAAFKKHPQWATDLNTLNKAVSSGKYTIVAAMIAAGANVNGTSADGRGLSSSILKGGYSAWGSGEHGWWSEPLNQSDILRLLLDAGYNVPRPSSTEGNVLGQSLLQLSGPEGADLLLRLIDSGGQFPTPESGVEPKFEMFFYNYATRWGARGPELIRALILKAHADPNMKYSDGSGGVLSFAFKWGNVEALKALKYNGVDLKQRVNAWGTGEDAARIELASIQQQLQSKTLPDVVRASLIQDTQRLQENIDFFKTL